VVVELKCGMEKHSGGRLVLVSISARSGSARAGRISLNVSVR